MSYFSPSEVCVVIVLGVVKMSCTKYMHAINETSLLFPLALRKKFFTMLRISEWFLKNNNGFRTFFETINRVRIPV